MICDSNVMWRIYDGYDWKMNRAKRRPNQDISQAPHERSKECKVEVRAQMVNVEYCRFKPESAMTSRLSVSIRDLDVMDNVDTSSWRKFLSFCTPGSGERPREDGSCMIEVEYAIVRPDLKFGKEEARLKVFGFLPCVYILGPNFAFEPEGRPGYAWMLG